MLCRQTVGHDMSHEDNGQSRSFHSFWLKLRHFGSQFCQGRFTVHAMKLHKTWWSIFRHGQV
ncbi:unnamed protein product [Coffea canephora]|uniref:Uncharacterized protein n=1 Tax=Coffea canephora TaxID=49390 RepID=A0A068V9L3_COFCA|nr:unnamed protein product [Coffea canephora]